MTTHLTRVSTAFILTTAVAVLPGTAFSENTATQNPTTPHQVTVEDKHPLAMGNKLLNQAMTNYKSGNLELTRQNLEDAKKWFQTQHFSEDEKTSREVATLVEEIQALQEKLSHPAQQEEGNIARLWHRSTSLIGREIDALKQKWHNASVANQIYRLLLDARLNFKYAEHELFRSQDNDKASKELKQVIAYLDQAMEIASPKIREQIAIIKSDINKLSNNSPVFSELETINTALDDALKSLEQVSRSESTEIQSRAKKLITEIANLKTDLVMLEKYQQYEQVMTKLRNLDALLNDE